MGVDTKLYLKNTWRLEDVKDAIASRFALERPITIEGTHTPSYVIMTVLLKGARYARNISCHLDIKDVQSNGGILLTLRADGEAKLILGTLAEALGGIFQPEDSKETYDMYEGMVWDSDGLAFFLKQAVIQNKLKNNDDIDGLADFIKEWNAKHKI